MALESYDIQTPLEVILAAPMTSDSTALSSIIFEEGNINNCYIIGVRFLNAY